MTFLPQTQYSDTNPSSPSGRDPPKVDKELVPARRRQPNAARRLLHYQPKQKPKTHNPQHTTDNRKPTSLPQSTAAHNHSKSFKKNPNHLTTVSHTSHGKTHNSRTTTDSHPQPTANTKNHKPITHPLTTHKKIHNKSHRKFTKYSHKKVFW